MKRLLTKLRRALGFFTREEQLRMLLECAASNVLRSREGCCTTLLGTGFISSCCSSEVCDHAEYLLHRTYGRDADNPGYWWGHTFSEEEQEARCLALLLLAEAHQDL